MNAGLLTSDSLTSLFRSLAQKRKSGVVDVTVAGVVIHISISGGKIVRAERNDLPLGTAVVQKLQQCGELGETIPDEAQNIEKLYTELVDSGLIVVEDFLRAKQAYEIDTLSSLAYSGEGFFEFHGQIVDVNPELSLGLTSGQFLLDLVQVKADRERIFGGLGGGLEDLKVRLTGRSAEVSELEQSILATLENSALVTEVAEKLLISDCELLRGVISLLDKELVSVVTDETPKDEPKAIPPPVTALRAPLEAKTSAIETVVAAAPASIPTSIPTTVPTAIAKRRPTLELSTGLFRFGNFKDPFQTTDANQLGFVVSLFLLFVLSIVSPILVSSWFEALRNFSSAACRFVVH